MKASKAQVQNLSRLTTQAAFDSLRKTKTRWVSPSFALQAIPQTAPQTPAKPAFCVITSKKTAKLATDRNRMRRRLRAIAYEIISSKAKPDMDYMIAARQGALTRSTEDLRKDLLWCLKRLDLLNHAD